MIPDTLYPPELNSDPPLEPVCGSMGNPHWWAPLLFEDFEECVRCGARKDR